MLIYTVSLLTASDLSSFISLRSESDSSMDNVNPSSDTEISVSASSRSYVEVGTLLWSTNRSNCTVDALGKSSNVIFNVPLSISSVKSSSVGETSSVL